MAVDVHSHVFNGSDLPIDGFILQSASAPRKLTEKIIGKGTKALEDFIHKHASTGANELARMKSGIESWLGREFQEELVGLLMANIPLLSRSQYADKVKRLAAIVLGDRRHAAKMLCEAYPDVKLFVPAMVDFDYRSQPATSLLDQIEVQSALSSQSTRGEIGTTKARICPFVAFNPLKEYGR